MHFNWPSAKQNWKGKTKNFWWFFFSFSSSLAQVYNRIKQTNIIPFYFLKFDFIFQSWFFTAHRPGLWPTEADKSETRLGTAPEQHGKVVQLYIRRSHHVSLIIADFVSFPVLMLMFRYERTNMTQNVTQLRERYKAIQEMIADAQRSQDHIRWGCHWWKRSQRWQSPK